MDVLKPVLKNHQVVYVLVGDREKFDQIAPPAVEHDNRAANRGHLFSKTLESTDLRVAVNAYIVVLSLSRLGGPKFSLIQRFTPAIARSRACSRV